MSFPAMPAPEMSPEEFRAAAVGGVSLSAPEPSPAVRALTFSSLTAPTPSSKRSRADDGFARAIIDSVSAAQRENAHLTAKLADVVGQLRGVVVYSRQLRAALEEADAVQTILEDAVARASDWGAHPLSVLAQKEIVALRERVVELESAAVFAHLLGAGIATPLIAELAPVAPAAPLPRAVAAREADAAAAVDGESTDSEATPPPLSSSEEKDELLASTVVELQEVRKSAKAASIRMQDAHAQEIATLKEAHAHAIARMMRPARSGVLGGAAPRESE
jgi:hypothetical protein